MAWWRRKQAADAGATQEAGLPIIRLEGITKIFKGDADEETHALVDVTAREATPWRAATHVCASSCRRIESASRITPATAIPQ